MDPKSRLKAAEDGAFVDDDGAALWELGLDTALSVAAAASLWLVVSVGPTVAVTVVPSLVVLSVFDFEVVSPATATVVSSAVTVLKLVLVYTEVDVTTVVVLAPKVVVEVTSRSRRAIAVACTYSVQEGSEGV